MELSRVLASVFLRPTGNGGQQHELTFENLGEYLEPPTDVPRGMGDSESVFGRLGPEVSQLLHSSGTISTDLGFEVESVSPFASVRCNTCFYAGSWMFEVVLGTSGVMQIGWCTLDTAFDTEEGVGDSMGSYAYDGARSKSWNVAPKSYGEPWRAGDVIGCCIDLGLGTLNTEPSTSDNSGGQSSAQETESTGDHDTPSLAGETRVDFVQELGRLRQKTTKGQALSHGAGRITFFRNGNSMGVAYRNVRLGRGVAYFPAASISYAQKCHFNFGQLPFRYPVVGYQPVQSPPSGIQHAEWASRSAQTAFSFVWDWQRSGCSSFPALSPTKQSLLLGFAVEFAAGWWLRASYFCHNFLLPLFLELQEMDNRYRYEHEHIPPFSKSCSRVPECLDHPVELFELESRPALFVDKMWLYLTEHEQRELIGQLFRALAIQWRTSVLSKQGRNPAVYLRLVVALCQSRRVISTWLQHDHFFDDLGDFFVAKQPNASDLAVIMPVVWWDKCIETGCDETEFEKDQGWVAGRLCEIFLLRTTLVKLLLRNSDEIVVPETSPEWLRPSGQLSIQGVFLRWVRELISRNRHATRNAIPPGLNHRSVLVSVFFSALHVLQPHLQSLEPVHYPATFAFLADPNARPVPPRGFHYFDFPRLGGLYQHLANSSTQISRELLDEAVPRDTKMGELSESVLFELFDSLVMLYHLGLATAFSRAMGALQNMIVSQAELDHVVGRLNESVSSPASSSSLANITVARSILRNELKERVRLFSWNVLALCRPHQQRLLVSFLSYLAQVINVHSSNNQSTRVFSFVPEAYLQTVVDTFHALRRTYPTFRFVESDSEHYADSTATELLQHIVTLMVNHFDDSRIIRPDLRNGMLQCLLVVAPHAGYLAAFEKNGAAREHLIDKILATYSSKQWVNISSFLLVFWKGRVFPELPVSTISAVPGQLFRAQFRQKLAEDPSKMQLFANQLFNTTGWSMTELAVVLKEVLPLGKAHHPNGEQLKQALRRMVIMFELVVGQLQLVECVALELAREAFLDNQGVSLLRLAELIVMALLRYGQCLVDDPVASVSSGVFIRPTATAPRQNTIHPVSAQVEDVLDGEDIPDLSLCEVVVNADPRPVVPGPSALDSVLALPLGPNVMPDTISRSKILAPIVGIIVNLLDSQTPIDGVDVIAHTLASALVSQPSFDLRYFNYLKSIDWVEQAVEPDPRVECFLSFVNGPLREIAEKGSLSNLSPTSSDQICSICYGNAEDTTFSPCGHRSCHDCISRHLLNSTRCFYCNAAVESTHRDTSE